MREERSIKAVQGISSAFNFTLLIILLLLGLLGIYALWDSASLYSNASHNHYKDYKPRIRDSRSFEDYQRANPDVIGWLDLYGTGVDYPIVHGQDNMKYLSHAPDGKYSASGSLYLDYRNNPNFLDFNNIIFGHHMDQHMMFGDLSNFLTQPYFAKHQYGKIYANHHWQGLDIYAVMEANAYDTSIYNPGIDCDQKREFYIQNIQSKAKYHRLENVQPADHIILMSTCQGDLTNGRIVLVAKITKNIHKDPFAQKQGIFNLFDHYGLLDELKRCPLLVWAILNLLCLYLILFIYNKVHEKRRST